MQDGALLKDLWKRFDKTKKSFVEICKVVDELNDADTLRKADPDIDAILKDYLSFAREHPAKQELLPASDDREKLLKMFLQAREKKLWENAELFLKKITTVYLGIDLDSPYEAVDQSDAKIAVLLGMLTHLGMGYWENNKQDEAIPFLEKATKFILVMRQVSDELWRRSAVSAYMCALGYYEKERFLDSIKACRQSISMFKCIRERSPQDEDCIIKAEDTLTKNLKAVVPVEKEIPRQTAVKTGVKKTLNRSGVPTSVPPKPAVILDLAQQRILFDNACNEGVLETATRCLETIGRCLNVDVFSPSDEVVLSDVNIRDLVHRLNTLSVMSWDDDKKQTIFLPLERWWNRLKEKSTGDWRTYISMRGEMANIYFEGDQHAKCISAVQGVLVAHENIKHEESEGDIEYLMSLCCDAAACCSQMDDAAQEEQWYQKADHYRMIVVKKIKDELQRLLAACDEDAAASLIRLRELARNYVLQNDEALESYVDEQTYIFASKLYGVFKACREGDDFEEAERVVSQVRVLLGRMEKRSDEAELLRIECGVQIRAFGISFEEDCNLPKAVEIAREKMSDKDKKKKEEIEARKKHDQAISGFKGSFRKFRKLDLNSDHVKVLMERRACVSNEMEESACDTVINACKALIAAYDVIHKCWSDIKDRQETDFLNLPDEALLARTQELDRARKYYESLSQLEEVLKASKEALSQIELKPLMVIRTFTVLARHVFFPQIIKLSESSPSLMTSFSLINRCERLLNDLVQSRRASNLKVFSDSETKLGNICEELFERYPGFQDILDNESHELYGIMSILESCRDNFVKVNRVANTMPGPQQIKEMCGKLQHRIEEVERLRKSCSL